MAGRSRSRKRRVEPRIIVVSGPRDSGKTRAAGHLAKRWQKEGLLVGGVLSRARLQDGQKVSYTYLEIGTRRHRQYARRKPGSVPPGQPAYMLREDGLEFGRDAILRAARSSPHVLIVDEMGPLEMREGGLWTAVRQVLADFRGRIVLTARPALVRRLRGMLDAGTHEIRVLTPAQAEEVV